MQYPNARIVPSPGNVQAWAAVPLQVQSCRGAPSKGLELGTSMHLPAYPTIRLVPPPPPVVVSDSP